MAGVTYRVSALAELLWDGVFGGAVVDFLCGFGPLMNEPHNFELSKTSPWHESMPGALYLTFSTVPCWIPVQGGEGRRSDMGKVVF